MNNQIVRFKGMGSVVRIIGLSAVLGSSLLVAQNGASEVAKVPFAFHVKDSALPAGEYVVRMTSVLGMVQIEDKSNGHSILLLTRGRESGKNATPRLTFHRYGTEYFLAQIWMPDQVTGYGISETTHEKELAKQPGQLVLASIRLQGN